ncbi:MULTISPECIES: hypothetical protein [unclassified Bradyrhizobium]|uniref:hypothetical protein n=1 Tax=unclassified Bradyrhizobium TaxID=2631580 RepID=UPI00247A5EAF|nr:MULTISPECIES: hypothetical protein [unclassified Bradyrhizobium]
MAKDPDKLAAELQTDDGLLGSVLAEENEFDRGMLWRLGSWGFAAVGAVTVAVMANQSSLTLERDQLAAADLARQAQQLQTLTKESHNETRRLALAIDTLNSDRDRLYSRVTTLEQSLDSITGAVAKQAQMPVAAPSTPATAPAAPGQANPPPATPVAAAPAVAPIATAPADRPAAAEKAAAAEKPVAAVKPQAASERPPAPILDNVSAVAASAAPAAGPLVVAVPAGADDGKPSRPKPAEPQVADTSIIGPPAPASSMPVEPAKGVTAAPMPDIATAARASDATADDAGAPKAQIQRTEFGVDLGTANSVNGLRALWHGLLKSKANAPLAALRPIIVIKESANGLGMQLHLVAGPLNDAGTAARICAELSLSHRACETAIYDGQRLSLKPDDTPPAGRPVHRRVAPKHVAVPPPPPPPVAEEKKPEPTTFSSIFRRNSQ